MNRRTATVMVDVLLLMLLVLVLLPHKPEDNKRDTRVGNMCAEIYWAENSQADVDLWLRTPGDIPVGYARLRGRYASLMRDDIGRHKAPIRHEIICTADIVNGEYVANVHLYSDPQGEIPIPVTFRAWYRSPSTGSVQVIWEGSTVLIVKGQEKTVVRWSMTDDRPDQGSIHHTQENLRSPNG